MIICVSRKKKMILKITKTTVLKPNKLIKLSTYNVRTFYLLFSFQYKLSIFQPKETKSQNQLLSFDEEWVQLRENKSPYSRHSRQQPTWHVMAALLFRAFRSNTNQWATVNDVDVLRVGCAATLIAGTMAALYLPTPRCIPLFRVCYSQIF